MLLDNHNNNMKVHEWISHYVRDGEFSIVTGYFTIAALVHFAKITNEAIAKYKFILGDITQRDAGYIQALDLLNADLSIENAIELKKTAKEAVAFLKLDSVELKTLEPNFCHAKMYLFKSSNNDPQHNFYISGSSNLTEAGIGLKISNNLELNLADFGGNGNYRELEQWFEGIWSHDRAHSKKLISKDDTGKEYRVDFKEYLIQEISRLFQNFSPLQIYYKILFELFGKDILIDIDNPEFAKSMGNLENTEIYRALYDFQKMGVRSLITKLEKHNGAILADAVGLGKTWSALAVIKYYQSKGREIILFCPKKLEHNWLKYREKQESRFEIDKLEYDIRFHTDLNEELMQKPHYLKDRSDYNFTNRKSKLLVIDESHNLRNDKSSRYNYLLDEIIKKNHDIKVLLLSATPLNNSFMDVRNQVKLIAKGDPNYFEERISVRNIDYLFKSAAKHFNQWQKEAESVVRDLVAAMDDSFFRLTDALLVARTRKMIAGIQNDLVFPEKAKPINHYITPNLIPGKDSIIDLITKFPPSLSGYQPSYFAKTQKERETRTDNILEDQISRDYFLIKMMYILMLKRLESSWYSFDATINKILTHHQNALNKVLRYRELNEDADTNEDIEDEDDDDFQNEMEELSLGKKQIKLSDIDKAGNIVFFEKCLQKDINFLEELTSATEAFSQKMQDEINIGIDLMTKSHDDKLQKLLKVIANKRASNNNQKNQKVLIFTAYSDTAHYLFNQLKARGFTKLAMIYGGGGITDTHPELMRNFEPILERFAPYTKLFLEKKWDDFHSTTKSLLRKYSEWKKWVTEVDSKVVEKLNNPIDILIATDTLSEGQNLQDCDMVINYDIHWNPVRTIQRLGRVDRLGSPNDTVYTVNFWPAEDLNSYLNLQGRIEKRMAAMKLYGAEDIKDFTESYSHISTDEDLDKRHTNRMLEQMKDSMDGLEDEKSFGFDELSLETFRQDLAMELNSRRREFELMPNGVFSGFKHYKSKSKERGMVALLGYPTRTDKNQGSYNLHRLAYFDADGENLMLNDKEILQLLFTNKDEERYGCDKLDIGDPKEVKYYVEALCKWFALQQKKVEIDEDGNIKESAGPAAVSILDKLKKGNADSINKSRKNDSVSEKYNKDNWDLIAWIVIK